MTITAQKRKSAFTLIELLMVVGMLAALAGIVLVSFSGAGKTARDTRRRSDLKQFQAAIETYANRSNGLYPNYGGGTNTPSLCSTLGLSTCSNDPQGSPSYRYYSSGGSGAAGSASATGYVLYATLEKVYSSQPNYFLVCSNGQSGRIPTSSWSPSGTCPAGIIQN